MFGDVTRPAGLGAAEAKGKDVIGLGAGLLCALAHGPAPTLLSTEPAGRTPALCQPGWPGRAA